MGQHKSDMQRLKMQGAMRECIKKYFMKEIALGMEKHHEEKHALLQDS